MNPAALVLDALRRHADPNGIAFTSMGALRRTTKLQPRPIKRSLRRLEGMGLIVVIPRYAPAVNGTTRGSLSSRSSAQAAEQKDGERRSQAGSDHHARRRAERAGPGSTRER